MLPTDLRVAGAAEPLGIERLEPGFSWGFEGEGETQSAYQLVVATTPDPVSETADVWDSGWVESDRQVAIAYDGPVLDPTTRYYWRVRVRDVSGSAGPWSVSAWFETGLDEWRADWIGPNRPVPRMREWPEQPVDEFTVGPDAEAPAPYFRTEFDAEAVETARLYICGAGCHDVYLNGDRVGDWALGPATTDYEERVLYSTVDVTDAVREGENALGVVVGRERYAVRTPDTWNWEQAPWTSAEPHLLCELHLVDSGGRVRRIMSDDTWHVGEGGIRRDSFMCGETFDARLEPDGWVEPGFDDSEWDVPRIVDGPTGDMVAEQTQPMRAVRRFEPAAVEKIDDTTQVIDVGEMVAGRCLVRAEGPEGTEITLTYGERRRDDGTIDVRDIVRGKSVREFVAAPLQTDQLVLGDDPVEWEPRLTYRGFRYVQVDDYPGELTPADLEVVLVHSDVQNEHSEFSAADDLLERVHDNTRRALATNLHGVPTDTPIYEKNGWTGDGMLTARAALYEYDMGRFHRKWLDDMADSQVDSGEISRIVPTSDWGYVEAGQFGGNYPPCPVWHHVYPLIPWLGYHFNGDRAVLAAHFDNLCALVEFHREHADGHLVRNGHDDVKAPVRGREGETPPEGPEITSTSYYARMVSVVADAAHVLDRPEIAARYDELFDDIRTAFNEEFLDRSVGVYATGRTDEYRQTSNVLPLAFGLVPEGMEDRVVANLITNLHEDRNGHLDTGTIGTRHLFPVLTRYGHVDAAYEAVTKTSYPGYGHWIENGATSLYEWWELHARSRNHHFFGTVDAWFYGSLAGIAPAEPGFRTVRIAPHLPTELDAASATVDTVRGPVSAEWERTGDGSSEVRLEVSIPANSRGQVYVPTADPDSVVTGPEVRSEVDAPSPLRGGTVVHPGGVGDDRPVYELPSGDWTLRFAPER